jgi:hypothetical protein
VICLSWLHQWRKYVFDDFLDYEGTLRYHGAGIGTEQGILQRMVKWDGEEQG